MVSAPIGKDSTYNIKTFQGGNQVSFTPPNLGNDFGLASVSFQYDAPSGDSIKDFELSPPKS